MEVKTFFRKIFGKTFYMHLKKVYYEVLAYIVYPLRHKRLIRLLKEKDVINVVFIASTLSMWRYQNLYELLSKHPRFKVSIVILPFIAYTKDQQKSDVVGLKKYFDSLNIKYYVGEGETQFNIRKELTPDILFYPQPYPRMFGPQNDPSSFKDKLLCYYPYDFRTSTGDWAYNWPFHNYAWKLFYSTDLHLKDAQRYAYNKGRNVEVVGYPNADNFLKKGHKDNWKPQSIHKKRIIWAPHYTISLEGYFAQSNFLWMADFMLELSEKYFDKLQFVFKPHPRLMTELYKHNDWGEKKTEDYYRKWASQENTQLETGEFIDLFMTSDAMIHDSASFSVEYHYSLNPVMYIADNFEQHIAEKGELGQLALRQHYLGKCKEDIIRFIEDVVLNNNDPMKQGRVDFYNKYLLPPNGKSVAENTMDVLLKAFC